MIKKLNLITPEFLDELKAYVANRLKELFQSDDLEGIAVLSSGYDKLMKARSQPTDWDKLVVEFMMENGLPVRLTLSTTLGPNAGVAGSWQKVSEGGLQAFGQLQVVDTETPYDHLPSVPEDEAARLAEAMANIS